MVVSMRSSMVSWMSSKRLPMVMKPRAARRGSSGEMSGMRSAASCSIGVPPTWSRAVTSRCGASGSALIARLRRSIVRRSRRASRATMSCSSRSRFFVGAPVEVAVAVGVPPDERGPLRAWSLAILGALEPVLSAEQFSRGVTAVAEFKAKAGAAFAVGALLATNGGSVADYAGKPNVRHGRAAPLVVVPTTAGTGSEASPSAGIHPDAVTASVGMNSRHLVPQLALLDPELTVSLPRRLTAATGIDALSHCIEGYLSLRDQPLGKSIALDGIRRVARHLPHAVADGQNLQARGEMMLAAFAGGVSIGMGLGPAHAIAITCSDQGFHHGILSGIGLIATLDATAAHDAARMVAVSEAFGLPAGASLAQGVVTLMRELGLPTSLAQLGYVANDLVSMASAAERSHFNLFAPFRPDASQYAAFLTQSLKPETNT